MTFGIGILEPIFSQYNYGPSLGGARDTFGAGATLNSHKRHLVTAAFPKNMTTRDVVIMSWAGTVHSDGDEPGYQVTIRDHDGAAHSTDWVFNFADAAGNNRHMAFNRDDCTRYTGQKAVSTELAAFCNGSGSGASASGATLSSVWHCNKVASEGNSSVYNFVMFIRRNG